MENQKHFVGVDVSKRTLDLFFKTSGKYMKITNDPKGFGNVLECLKTNGWPLDSIIILMEYTGYLTFLFEKFLIKHDLRYAKVNGLALKRSVGLARGKSDKMDARRIAEYAATNVDKLRFQRPRTKATERLKMLIMERNKCIKIRTGLKNTLEEMSCIHLPSNDLIMRSPQVLINALNRQIKALEKEMDAVIREDRDLHRNYLLLQSVKGVGAIVAINTLIKTNNFEWFTNAREFACCCGLAPFEHTSGSSIRGRTRVSHMADKQMKTLFDLAAKVAIRYDPEMKAYYERRVSEGKAKMSAINVVRNKIVGRMFAVIKRQTPYKSAYMNAA